MVFNQKPIGYKGMTNEEETSNELRLSSVEKDVLPICQISYNKDGYSSHCVDYKNQKEWEANRNPQRYLENKGKMFDRKNVAHSVRLLHMGLDLQRQDSSMLTEQTLIGISFLISVLEIRLMRKSLTTLRVRKTKWRKQWLKVQFLRRLTLSL